LFSWVSNFSSDEFNLTFLGEDDITVKPFGNEIKINLCGKARCFADSYESFACGTFLDRVSMETIFLSGDKLTFVNTPQYSRKGVLARIDSTAKNTCVVSILLLCDPTLNETSIPIMEEHVIDNCRTHFVIRSPYACRKCGVLDMVTENGACVNDKMNRTIRRNTQYCIGNESVQVVECHPEVTVLTSWIICAIVGGALVLICIAILIIVLVVRNRRIYGKYQKLIIASETGDAFAGGNDDEDEAEFPAPAGNKKDADDDNDDDDGKDEDDDK